MAIRVMAAATDKTPTTNTKARAIFSFLPI
jgi:hypothetical protein